MFDSLKQKATEFKYWAARKKPTLKQSLENNDFAMATYILQNKPETITDTDIKIGTHFMLPGIKCSYDDKRDESLSFLNTLLETDFASQIPAINLGSLFHCASVHIDAEMLETLFKFPQSLEVDRKTFHSNTYYYFVVEDDPRRTAFDKRPCDIHKPEGYPEMVKVIDRFAQKRKEHWENKKTCLRTKRGIRKANGVRSVPS